MSDDRIKQIPKGHYCYTPDEIQDEPLKFKIKLCPFWIRKNINGVQIPFCTFLDQGGTPNPGDTDGNEKMEKLIQHYGSVEKVWEELSLDLLWDQVKECNHNENTE